jgi:hypothetical protein
MPSEDGVSADDPLPGLLEVPLHLLSSAHSRFGLSRHHVAGDADASGSAEQAREQGEHLSALTGGQRCGGTELGRGAHGRRLATAVDERPGRRTGSGGALSGPKDSRTVTISP